MKFCRIPILIFSLSLLPLTGSFYRASSPRSHSIALKTNFDQKSAVLRAMVLRGEYMDALAGYRQAAEDARSDGQAETQRLFLNNLGACQISLFQYREALSTLTMARTLAAAAGDKAALARLDTNISSLYSQTENLSEASRAVDNALKYQSVLHPRSRAVLFLQAGNVKAQMGKLREAEPFFFHGIESALEAGEPETAAWGWDYLGYSRRKAGDLAAADAAIVEGFRLRKLLHLGSIESSYMNLGVIRAQRGDTASAIRLLDEAEKVLQKTRTRTPAWRIYTERGRVKMQAGLPAAALSDFRQADSLARVWRADVVPNDANRSSSEATLEDLYGLLIEAGNQLYEQTRDPALLRETFEAAEENRAASLRAMVPRADDWRSKLPGRYWQALAQLRAAQATWVRSGEKGSPAIVAAQSELAEIEAAAGAPPAADQTKALEKARAVLDSHSVLFSFRLGDQHSWVWELTENSLVLRKAPGRIALTRLAAAFSKSTEQNIASPAGEQLYRELFGEENRNIEGRKRWLLALEGDLFEIPFPALPLKSGQPLITAHSVQIISGAHMLRRRQTPPDLEGPFLGIGDPIYNQADPRLAERTVPHLPNLLSRVTLNTAGASAQPSFARLWGTGREISESAKIWGAERSILLTGGNASETAFWAAVERKPSIIHLATHILEKDETRGTGWIALSRHSDGRLDYLTPAQISARSLSARLVVLSGCSSGKAEIRKASGLMGLTRAWIAAGAGSVLATRWPTVDDDGAFFQSFYYHFRADPISGPAEALRQATIEMLNSGTWRSNASFWGGYFLVGNE